MDFEQIRQDYPIEEMMSRLGCDMTHRGYMYRAPYREDRNPSMHVDRSRNIWCDYGLSRSDGTPMGGGNIELIRMVEGIGSNREAAQRILELFGREERIQEGAPSRRPVQKGAQEPGVRVDMVMNLIASGSLKYYLRQRGISPSLASKWCSEVYFTLRSTGSRLFAVGFRTDRGTWSLRNSFFKGSTGQGISTIAGGRAIVGPVDDGVLRHHPDAGKGSVALFEGFMDYLSWLTLSGTSVPPCDAVVLNSTSNLGEAIPFLSTHGRIECWLDNDDAGRQCLSIVRERCRDSTVVDRSTGYASCKDLNEHLVSSLERQEIRQESRELSTGRHM